VVFPNSDTVAHQVYSFSPAKHFELPLYRGQAHPPIVLDHAGLVVVGCNIHDSMLGYIYVTDSPYFSTSDSQGTSKFSSLPAVAYDLTVWSARLPRDAAQATQRVVLQDAPASVQVRLTAALRPPIPASNNSRVRDY